MVHQFEFVRLWFFPWDEEYLILNFACSPEHRFHLQILDNIPNEKLFQQVVIFVHDLFLEFHLNLMNIIHCHYETQQNYNLQGMMLYRTLDVIFLYLKDS